MQTVYVRGFGDVGFPDDWSEDQMHEALSEKFAGFKPAGVTEHISRALTAGGYQMLSSHAAFMQAHDTFIKSDLATHIAPAYSLIHRAVRSLFPEETAESEVLTEQYRLDSLRMMDQYQMDPELQTPIADVYAKEGLVGALKYGLGARRLGYQVSQFAVQMIPTILATYFGGPAAGTIVAGGLGAVMEGGGTYNQIKAMGYDDETAAAGFLGMAGVAGGLNALGFNALLNKLAGAGLAGRVASALLGQAIEAGTEFAEEPGEAWVLNTLGIETSYWQAMRQGADVIIPAFFAGSPISVPSAFSGYSLTKPHQDAAVDEVIKEHKEGKISTEQAVEALSQVRGVAGIPLAERLILSRLPLEGKNGLMAKLKAKGALNVKDWEWAVARLRFIETKRKERGSRTFTEDSDYEQYLRDNGIKQEGDEIGPILNEAERAQYRRTHGNGRPAEFVDLELAIIDRMVYNVAQLSGKDARAMLDESFGGFAGFEEGADHFQERARAKLILDQGGPTQVISDDGMPIRLRMEGQWEDGSVVFYEDDEVQGPGLFVDVKRPLNLEFKISDNHAAKVAALFNLPVEEVAGAVNFDDPGRMTWRQVLARVRLAINQGEVKAAGLTQLKAIEVGGFDGAFEVDPEGRKVWRVVNEGQMHVITPTKDGWLWQGGEELRVERNQFGMYSKLLQAIENLPDRPVDIYQLWHEREIPFEIKEQEEMGRIYRGVTGQPISEMDFSAYPVEEREERTVVALADVLALHLAAEMPGQTFLNAIEGLEAETREEYFKALEARTDPAFVKRVKKQLKKFVQRSDKVLEGWWGGKVSRQEFEDVGMPELIEKYRKERKSAISKDELREYALANMIKFEEQYRGAMAAAEGYLAVAGEDLIQSRARVVAAEEAANKYWEESVIPKIPDDVTEMEQEGLGQGQVPARYQNTELMEAVTAYQALWLDWQTALLDNEDLMARAARARGGTLELGPRTYPDIWHHKGEKASEIVLKVPEEVKDLIPPSVHFPQQGTIGWARVSEITVGGKTYLHIEEIQSDWIQELERREHRYAPAGRTAVSAEQELLRKWEASGELLVDAANRRNNLITAVLETLAWWGHGVDVTLPSARDADQSADLFDFLEDQVKTFLVQGARSGSLSALRVARGFQAKFNAEFVKQSELEAALPESKTRFTPMAKNFAETWFRRMFVLAAERGYAGVTWNTGGWQNQHQQWGQKRFTTNMGQFYDKRLGKEGDKIAKAYKTAKRRMLDVGPPLDLRAAPEKYTEINQLYQVQPHTVGTGWVVGHYKRSGDFDIFNQYSTQEEADQRAARENARLLDEARERERWVHLIEFGPESAQLIKENAPSLYQQGEAQPRGKIGPVIEGKKDLIEPWKPGHEKLVIRALSDPEFPTGIHEMTHYLALTATGPFRETIEKAMGKNLDKWTRKDHESFARGFEKYLFQGPRAMPPHMLPVFRVVRAKMREVYATAKDIMEQEIPVENQKVYNMLLMGPDTAMAVATFQDETSFLFQNGEEPPELLSDAERQELGVKTTRYTANEPPRHCCEVIKAAREAIVNDENFTEFLKRVGRGDAYDQGQPFESPEDMLAAAYLIWGEHVRILDSMLEGEITPETARRWEQYREYLAKKLDKTATHSGRMLYFLRLVHAIDDLNAAVQGIAEMPPSLARRVGDTDYTDLQQVTSLLREVKSRDKEGKKGWKDAFMGLLYNSWLSSPTTWSPFGINTVSNLLFHGYYGLHRGPLAAADAVISKLTGKPRDYYFGDSFTVLRSLAQGLGNERANSAFKQALWGEDPTTGADTVWDEMMRGHIGALESYLEDHYGPNGKTVGKILSGPTRALRAFDLWFKGIAEQWSEFITDEHYRRAVEAGEGEAYIKALEDKILKDKRTASRFHRLVAEMKHAMTPEDRYAIIRKVLAQKDAEHLTFQDAPGSVLHTVINLRNRMGFVGRVMVPFIQTVANVSKRGVEFIPGGGALAGMWWNDWTLKSPELWATQVEGLGMVLGIATMFGQGLLTGGAPGNPRERERFYAEGKIPYAAKIGGRWIQYSRLEPFGMPLGVVTDLLQMMADINEARMDPTKKEVTLVDGLARAVSVVNEGIIQSSYMQGALKTLGTKESDLRSRILWTTASFVPYSPLWRAANRSYEAGTTGQVKIMENRTFMDTFGQALPSGITGLLEEQGILKPKARLGLFGEEVSRKSNWFMEWTPFRYQPVVSDPVENTLQALNFYPSLPSREMSYRGIRILMPEDLYREHTVRYGTMLKEQWDSLVRRPGFQALPDWKQKILLQRIRSRVSDLQRRQSMKKMLPQFRQGLLMRIEEEPAA